LSVGWKQPLRGRYFFPFIWPMQLEVSNGVFELIGRLSKVFTHVIKKVEKCPLSDWQLLCHEKNDGKVSTEKVYVKPEKPWLFS
jgi:hypothetical protein